MSGLNDANSFNGAGSSSSNNNNNNNGNNNGGSNNKSPVSGGGVVIGGATATKKEKLRSLSPKAKTANSSGATSFHPLFSRGGGGSNGNGIGRNGISSNNSYNGAGVIKRTSRVTEEDVDDDDDDESARKSAELPMTKEVVLAFVRSSPVLIVLLLVLLGVVAILLVSEGAQSYLVATSSNSSTSPSSTSLVLRRFNLLRDEATAYLVLVTVPIENFNYEEFARELLEKKLVACVSAMNDEMTSTYWWKGKIETSRERQLILKTTEDKLSELELEIKRKHPYEVPEIVHLPIAGGSAEYLQWLRRSVSQTSTAS